MQSSSYMQLIQKQPWMHSKKILKGENNVKKKTDDACISGCDDRVCITGCGSKDDSKTSRSESKKTEQQKSDAKKEKAAEKEETKAPIEDGTYTAEFKTDSSMFHVNDAYDDKGTLTVKDGKMTIHISLVSKNIVNLFPGTIKDAKKKGAKILQPTTDTITDENGNAVIGIDGKPKEVYGFDVPVPALDEEFDLALIGTKGKWYNHKVSVSNPVKAE